MPSTSVIPFPSAPSTSSSGNAPDESQLLIGPSPITAQFWEQTRRVAPYFRTALLTGEPGSGAAAAARALHSLSPAARRPFFILTAAEAEERLTPRATTYAPAESTIFLPEVARLTMQAQSGLSRLLRQRVPMAIHVIAFSTGSLRPLVSAGSFSAELASTLEAVRITLPSLRNRLADLPHLVNHLLQKQATARGRDVPRLSAEFFCIANAHPWPGNLNELNAALKWLMKHNTSEELHGHDLEAALGAITHLGTPEQPKVRLIKLDDVLHEHLRAVLLACHGNKLRAAEVLGISRSTLYRMLESKPSGLALVG